MANETTYKDYDTSTADGLNGYMADTACATARTALERGAIPSAQDSVTKAGGYAGEIVRGALRDRTLGLVSATAQKIVDLDKSGKAADLQRAAAEADSDYVNGIREESKVAEAVDKTERADLANAMEAQRLGLDPSIAYNFGLGAASIKDAVSKIALPGLGILGLVVVGIVGLYLFFLFGRA